MIKPLRRLISFFKKPATQKPSPEDNAVQDFYNTHSVTDLSHTDLLRLAIARLWVSNNQYSFTSRELHEFILTTYGNVLSYSQVLKALFKLHKSKEVTKTIIVLTSYEHTIRKEKTRNHYTITQQFDWKEFDSLENGKS
jgi:hypothetical protein